MARETETKLNKWDYVKLQKKIECFNEHKKKEPWKQRDNILNEK